MGASNFWRLQLCTNLWAFWLSVEDWDNLDAYICQDTIDAVVADLKSKDFFWETLKNEYENYKIIWYFNVEYYNRVGKYWDSNEYYIVVEYGYHEGGRFDIVAHEDGYFSNIYINKAYDKRLKKTISECEKIFEKYTTPMRRVGGFSDGTSLYSKV